MVEDITNEKVLDFTGEKSTIYMKLEHSPEEYIDQIDKMDHPIVLIEVNGKEPQKFYEGLRELVKHCDDNVCIKNLEVMEIPNKKEFLKGEQIIEDILKEVNPDWNAKQKIAFVHHKMGKIVSYCPDFKYACQDNSFSITENTRIMWNALSSGIGVCNGIAHINMSILSRLGIDSEFLNGKAHEYLCIKTDEGNIITDPTWDLFRTLYDGRPNYFGRTYEDIIESEKPFTAHVVKNPPDNVISIPEDEMREIFHSIGLTDEERKFPAPILQLVNQIEETDKSKRIDDFFKLYMESFKEESTHICESIDMLEACMCDLQVNKVSFRCVYRKEDVECKEPILIFHSGDEELKDNVYIFPGKTEDCLKMMKVNEFDHNYKIHNRDERIPFWREYMKNNLEIEKEKEEYEK